MLGSRPATPFPKGTPHDPAAPASAPGHADAQLLAPHPSGLPPCRGPVGPALPPVAGPTGTRGDPGLFAAPHSATPLCGQHVQPGPLCPAVLLPGDARP